MKKICYRLFSLLIITGMLLSVCGTYYKPVQTLAAEKLMTPTVTVSSTTETAVSLSWKKITDAKGYRVYRYNDNTGKYAKVKTTSKLYYTDKNLTAGTTYSYKIQAVSGKKGISNSSKSKAVKAVTQAEKIIETEKTTEKETVTESGIYSAKDFLGNELSATTGEASTVTRYFSQLYSGKNGHTVIPDLELWSGGAFYKIAFSEKENSFTKKTCRAMTYHLKDSTAFNMLEDYISLLTKKYNLVQTDSHYLDGGSYKWTHWTFDYSGSSEITKDAASPIDFEKYICDFAIVKYDGYEDKIYVEYPVEIDMADTGEYYPGVTEKETRKNTTALDFKVDSNGYECYSVSGFSNDSTDYLILRLLPDSYSKGDVITLADFNKQAAAGDSAKYRLIIKSSELCDSVTSSQVNSAEEKYYNSLRFDDMRVEILEKSASVTAAYYYVYLHNDMGDYFLLEGVFTAQTGDGAASDIEPAASEEDTGSIPVIAGKTKCPHCDGGYTESFCLRCNGTGKRDCTECSGTGKVRCTKCGGDGEVWDALNGRSKSCINCGGDGKLTCSKCHGWKTIECPDCLGKKKLKKKCIYCGGTGYTS